MIPFVLAAGEIWTNPIIVGLVVGIPTSVLGYMAYRRAEALDRSAAVTAAQAAEGASVQRVIDGLDDIIKNLRDDNKEAREYATNLRSQLRECHTAYDDLKRMIGTP